VRLLDKNPHPDAKVAFDCLQDAYYVATEQWHKQEEQRYQQQLRPPKKTKVTSLMKSLSTNKASMKKFVSKYSKQFNYKFENWKARFNLLAHRIRAGQWREEFTEVVGIPLRHLLDDLRLLKDRFCYAPSNVDRLQLCGELLYDHKKEVAVTAVSLGLLCYIYGSR
jgi:hypothetical protein